MPNKYNDIVVAIPTTERAEAGVSTLEVAGVRDYPVVLFVDDKDADKKYYERYPDLNIVVGPRGIAAKRNFIYDYFPVGTRLVCLDDDIKGFYSSEHKKPEPMTFTEVAEIGYDALAETGLKLWGIYPMIDTRPPQRLITFNTFCIGRAYGIINTGLKTNGALEAKGDYEFTVLNYVHNGGSVRLDYIRAQARCNQAGGLSGVRTTEMSKRAAAYLLKTYPWAFRPHPRRIGEVILHVRKPR